MASCWRWYRDVPWLWQCLYFTQVTQDFRLAPGSLPLTFNEFGAQDMWTDRQTGWEQAQDFTPGQDRGITQNKSKQQYFVCSTGSRWIKWWIICLWCSLFNSWLVLGSGCTCTGVYKAFSLRLSLSSKTQIFKKWRFFYRAVREFNGGWWNRKLYFHLNMSFNRKNKKTQKREATWHYPSTIKTSIQSTWKFTLPGLNQF